MKRYNVSIGNGMAGDTLQLRARSEADARAQALASDMMINNPSWVIQEVTEETT